MECKQFFRLFALVAITFTVLSCQKDELSPADPLPRTRPDDIQYSERTCNHPLFADQQVTSACSEGNSCTISAITPTKRNMIRFRVASGCGGNYNFYGVPAAYHIYKYSTMSGVYEEYQKIASFNCLSANVWYASALLTNNTNFVILAEEQPSTSYPPTIYWQGGFVWASPGTPLGIEEDDWRFTTLNHSGMACDVK